MSEECGHPLGSGQRDSQPMPSAEVGGQTDVEAHFGDGARPRARGSFIACDEPSTSLLIALGHLVVGAAGLEKTLQLELARVHYERANTAADPASYGLEKRLTAVERLTGGQARHALRELGLPANLDARIRHAVDRRNALLHRPMEDVQLIKAVTTGVGVEAVADRVNRLALDCGELAVELEAFARRKVEATSGKSRAEIFEMVRGLDPQMIEDPHMRQQVEAVQAAGALDWAGDQEEPRKGSGTSGSG